MDAKAQGGSKIESYSFYIDNEINDEKITDIDIIILGSCNWHNK